MKNNNVFRVLNSLHILAQVETGQNPSHGLILNVGHALLSFLGAIFAHKKGLEQFLGSRFPWQLF